MSLYYTRPIQTHSICRSQYFYVIPSCLFISPNSFVGAKYLLILDLIIFGLMVLVFSVYFHVISQVGLNLFMWHSVTSNLLIFLHVPYQWWAFRHVPPFLVYMVIWLKSRPFCVLDNHSIQITELFIQYCIWTLETHEIFTSSKKEIICTSAYMISNLLTTS